MAEVLLFHHAYGLTAGVQDFAATLRGAGHTVHVPDLYDGRTFGSLEAGIGYAQEVGFDAILERGKQSAEAVDGEGLVYAGFSLGVMPAQMLAQTRGGAAGALLISGCVPVSEFGGSWPQGVPVQIHGMDADEIFVGDGDLDAAREIVETAADAELFLYEGDRHMFIDNSLPDYDAQAAGLLTERVLTFLSSLKQ